MIDFGKRLTQTTREREPFFFLRCSTKTHEREPRKKKRGLVGKKFGSCYESTTLMYVSK